MAVEEESASNKYICPYCSAEFVTVDSMKSHMKAEHPHSPADEPEEAFIKATSLSSSGHGGGAVRVEAKNGRLVRIRPLHYDEKYTAKEIGQWRVKARGKVFETLLKTTPNPIGLAYKKRVYSPNRIRYPLKRVDWNPSGERNPQNRGRSKYKRISWEEATDIIASEIKRIKKEYGLSAILLQGDGHGETKIVHGPHGCNTKLLECISEDKEKGDYTLQIRTPDSWEGWKWGAIHMWGMQPLGTFRPETNSFKEIAEHTDIIFFWGGDLETTPWMFGGQDASLWTFFYKEIGIKMIFVSPDLNYSGVIHADKWIPVYPGTDGALHLAIVYTWIKEDTYDKDYIATHTTGFDKFKAYVMGEEDGIPKTPKWASPLCGVPVWTIKALAREWASKVASMASNTCGPLCRVPYSTEPIRLKVACHAMQGLGKLGTSPVAIRRAPRSIIEANPFNAYRGLEEAKQGSPRWHPKQFIPKTRICEAILEHSHENPMKFWSTGAFLTLAKDQFNQYQYPVEGCSEIHMIWSDTPCWQTCWNQGNKIDKAFRDQKIETVIVQHPWLENDTLYADIILPICTKYELQDIMIGRDQFYQTVYPEGKCIEPIGESMSDYEAVGEIAKKLSIYKEYTKGRTVEEWMKHGFENSGVEDLISWEELNEKGFYVVPTAPDWEKDTPGIYNFYKDPGNYPLDTPTGKIEFESTALLEHFPDDDERPPLPRWIAHGKTHQESRLHPRAEKYPLLMMSNHPRWRIHANLDDITWLREIETCKIKAADGYAYQPCWINPEDAAERDIKHGDIVKVYNERGVVLAGAYVTERIKKGAVSIDHGARCDPIIAGKVDRGGAINLICPAPTLSPNTQGQVGSAFLVEVAKVTQAEIDEWKKQNPDAFEREYDPAAGLRFSGWIEGDT